MRSIAATAVERRRRPSAHQRVGAAGKFLMLLAQSMGARRILEIGTLGGYSAIWLAQALPPGGRLLTLEVDPLHASVARENIARAGLSAVVEVRRRSGAR